MSDIVAVRPDGSGQVKLMRVRTYADGEEEHVPVESMMPYQAKELRDDLIEMFDDDTRCSD